MYIYIYINVKNMMFELKSKLFKNVNRISYVILTKEIIMYF